MLKELHKIFQRKSLMEEALTESCKMLEIDRAMFVGAVRSLREREDAELDFDIYELDRKVNEGFWIEGRIFVKVLGIRGHRTKLGVEAPPDVEILREELRPSAADRATKNGEIPTAPRMHRRK